MADTLLNYGTYIILLYIIKEYLDIFLTVKDYRKIKIFAIWTSYFILQLIVSPIIKVPIISTLFNIGILFSLCEMAYQGIRRTKLILTVSFVTLWMIVELLTGYILIIVNIKVSDVAFLGSIISKIVLFAILKIIRSKVHITDLEDIGFRYWISLLILPSCSIVLIYNLYTLEYKDAEYVHLSSTISIFLILFLNVMFYNIYGSLSKTAELQKQNCIYEKQIELCKMHIQERAQMDVELREIQHNMKGYLICIKEYLDKKDEVALSTYLSGININFKDARKICDTGNVVIDAIINTKYRECLKRNINFEIEIKIPCNNSFNNADLSVILENALENAVDATLKLPNKQRYIKVNISFHHYNLLIEIKNSFDGNIKKSLDGRYLTIKTDFKNHGIGLKSIERAASKYQGLVDPQILQNEFQLTILLYGI
jgi:two-component system, LytTR family, sensor histidine kinase AgrC